MPSETLSVYLSHNQKEEPLRFTYSFAVKEGKWELIWNKLLFSFTLLTGNPLRNTERVPDQCFRGQLSPEHVNV